MKKKGSIFNFFRSYFSTHPLAVLGWIWVTFVPALGSILLVSQYSYFEELSINSVGDHFVLILILGIVMGFALLPTTLTAVFTGYLMGVTGLVDLLIGYTLANILGYGLGMKFNSDFLELLFLRQPQLSGEIEKRKKNPGELIFFIRISPLIPFAISNFIFASLKVPLKQVLKFGIPGMLPRTLIAFATGMLASSFLSAREALQEPWQILFLLLLLLLSSWGIYRNLKIKKA
ncbi:VTT domain-containing protein [Algoriphagus sp. CAU 1675]|uniref:VTT domain-containing protein n=1 Tax=Algoriphagus sp. CAU 1675 TaxID=3032597 RepID=UPI0023DC25FE|nr:VTT domain-containing protein [Algoriphagus sp. CAU 1675]MDF2157195.1 VTT domain-containing protein [Algoriphagus sp. CAU 1675]